MRRLPICKAGATTWDFAASAVVPLDSGISHHQEGNNIYGLYGRMELAAKIVA